MRRWLALAGILAAICACSPGSTIDGGRLGQVRVVKPEGTDRHLVVMFSDAGWTGQDDAAARALAHDGALVVGVDTAAYLKTLSQSHDERLYLVNDVFTLSQQVQREAGLATYLMPIVAGIGQGGTLAELILAQAPPATLAGAVSIDPTATIDLARPLAAAPPARPHDHEDLQRDAALDLPGFWAVGLTPDGPPDGRARVRRLKQAGMAIDIRELANATEPAGILTATLAPYFKSETGPSDAPLPIVELPVDRPSDVMAVLFSGDGGWADIDKSIAEDLQRDGVPVIGWDSLKYFWAQKTPDQTAKDLANVMATYLQRWHASKVLLIGYSLGADVLPFAYNRLPEKLRRQVTRVALLAVEEKTDFKVTVDGWLQLGPSDKALPIEPEVAKIPPALVLCVYGADEKHSGCPGLAAPGVTIIRTSGAHHFDGDYKALEKRIAEASLP